MAWIIATIVIVIAVLFWRVSVPFGVLAVIVIGLLSLYAHYDNQKKAREKEAAKTAFHQKVSRALEDASPEGKEWHVDYVKDPATAKNMARDASIISNDGLCRLVVEKRPDGSDRAGLHCPDFKKYGDNDMEIKFDNATTSDKIDIGRFNDNSGVYISPFIFVSPAHIDYKEFIEHLKEGNTLAIKIPAEEGVWVRFKLEGGADALSRLGKPQTPVVPGDANH
jgi:hypothetical protein